jgi:N-acetylglucosamine PTS system EIIB component
MFEKLHQAFWKALTPDLVADEPAPNVSTLASAVVAVLAAPATSSPSSIGVDPHPNVELNDTSRVDPHALRLARVPGVMRRAVCDLVGVND